MNINIITAMSKNRGIGINNTLPWNLKKDLKRFKILTSNTSNIKSAIIMGKNTWESLPIKPLPNRTNFVVSKTLNESDNINILRNPSDIKFICNEFDKIWICGGEKIYNYYINKPYVNNIYVTYIDKNYNSDTFFPNIPKNYSLYNKSCTYNESKNSINYIKFNYLIYKNNNIINIKNFYKS